MFGGDIIGGLIQKKPDMPGFQKVEAGAEQQKAISSNISALPDLEKLVSQYTDFTSDERLKQLNKFIPGYSDVIKKEGEQISNLLQGKLPAGVQDTISRRAAELGVTQGTSGSDFQKFGELRELGLTSLNAITMGFDAASRWMSSAEKPAQFDFSSMFLTPQQQIGLDVGERNLQFQHDWAQELLNMQYDPRNIIGSSLIQTDRDLVQIASSVAGKAGGAMF